MSIEVVNATYVYMPGTPFESKALDGVSLSIKDGEFIGLIGHTGSGKSTLAQHFNALLKPTLGSVYVNSLNLNDTCPLRVTTDITLYEIIMQILNI